MNKQTAIFAILVIGIAGGFASTEWYIDKAALIHSRTYSPALSQTPSPSGSQYSRVKGFVSYGPSYYRRGLIFIAPNLKALETDALAVSGTVRLAGSAPNHSQLSFLEVSEVNVDSGASRSGIPVTVDKAGSFDAQIPLTLGGGNYELRVSDPLGGQRLQSDVVINDAVVALHIYNTSGGVSSSSTSAQIRP